MTKICGRCRRNLPSETFIDVTTGAERKQCDKCRTEGRARFKAYYEANSEVVNANIVQRREADPEKYRAQRREERRRWRKKFPDKKAQKNRDYWDRNPGRAAALRRKREERVLQATPAWADHAKIQEVYERAARLRTEGQVVHVDHHYPLAGRKVSGLHVHFNLRIVGKHFNLKKSNS